MNCATKSKENMQFQIGFTDSGNTWRCPWLKSR